jgi:hypothetical protein
VQCRLTHTITRDIRTTLDKQFGPLPAQPKPCGLREIIWQCLFCTLYCIVLWCIDPLLGNARNTHPANNTGAVFSVVRARTVAMQRTLSVFSRARWRHATIHVMQAGVFYGSAPRILSHVQFSVANNNGFWIGWLGLLSLSFKSTHNYSQL